MHSIQVHLLIRYVLVGSIILFFACSGEALPTRARQGARKTLSSKRPLVVKNPLKASLAKHAPAKSCPMRAPKSRLHKRAVTHPSGKEQTILFHGTTTRENAEAIEKKVDLSKTSREGDLHSKRGACHGGLYLTDSVIAAAQFICNNKPSSNVRMAYVLEFKWDPKACNVYEFPPNENVSKKQCQAHDMVTGPMNKPFSDVNLTPSFWQYAIVNQATADAGLRYQATHVIPCKKNTGQPNIPLARDLTDEIYMRGQKENRGFSSLLASLKEGAFQFCPA